MLFREKSWKCVQFVPPQKSQISAKLTKISVARKAFCKAIGASCAVPGCSLLQSTRTTFTRNTKSEWNYCNGIKHICDYMGHYEGEWKATQDWAFWSLLNIFVDRAGL